jgi:hypothetical protein
VTLQWRDTLSAKDLKNMVARTAKYPELNQHVFVGTRCLTGGEEVKEGNINIVMTFTTPMVKAMPCGVSVNKKVSAHKATQDVPLGATSHEQDYLPSREQNGGRPASPCVPKPSC